VPKHLGSFAIKDGTGKSGGDAVLKACEDWGMSKELPEKVPAMQVFDTCSANTGKIHMN
jgi:hypothetical protein